MNNTCISSFLLQKFAIDWQMESFKEQTQDITYIQYFTNSPLTYCAQEINNKKFSIKRENSPMCCNKMAIKNYFHFNAQKLRVTKNHHITPLAPRVCLLPAKKLHSLCPCVFREWKSLKVKGKGFKCADASSFENNDMLLQMPPHNKHCKKLETWKMDKISNFETEMKLDRDFCSKFREKDKSI